MHAEGMKDDPCTHTRCKHMCGGSIEEMSGTRSPGIALVLTIGSAKERTKTTVLTRQNL